MNLGKKILSAFVEVEEDKLRPQEAESSKAPAYAASAPTNAVLSDKFVQHFDKLFQTRNLPGPDYFEMSKMLEAMESIADEKARFAAAFAGLRAQGLSREQLLLSADTYLKMLAEDASQFQSTVDQTLHEKVEAKRKAVEDKTSRIEALSREMASLQQEIESMAKEIETNNEKIRQNEGGYQAALTVMQNRIHQDIEKIKQHIS